MTSGRARLPLPSDLLLDLRYALRVLRKSPAFTLVAALTLTLGIGANVVVFGVTNAVLLRPLEVRDPQSLYQVRLQPWAAFKALTTSYPAFEDLRERNVTFSGLAGFNGYSSARLRWRETVRRVSGQAVSGSYFALLGVRPAVGRLLQEADERGPEAAPAVVLSHRLWQSVFQGDPGVVGTAVELDRTPFTVVGVAPPGFHGTERLVWPDYWIPLSSHFGPDSLRDRSRTALTVLGRLKPGVTPGQAAENLSAIAAQLAEEHPETDSGTPLRLVRPGLYGDTGDVIRGFLYGVTGLGLLVLVAACANLASLFAARAADRRRELASRAALGATRWRLVRQLLIEALVVSLLGGAGGLAVAGLLLGVLDRWESPYGLLAVGVDARVCLAALALTLAAGLFFGMAPARQVWRPSQLQAIKSGPVDAVHPRRLAPRDLLLAAQIAICALLITGSLVAVRGMVRLLNAPLGFEPRGALLAELDLSLVEPAGDLPLARKRALIEAVRSTPGVAAAGTVNRVPFTGGLRGVPVFRPGTTGLTLDQAALEPYVFTMSPGYLEAAGTRLLEGRDVSWHDTAETPAVAVVNRTFARRMWGGAPALGRRFLLRDRATEVVGVAEDGKYHSLQEPPQPVVYLALPQNEQSAMIFVARSRGAQDETAAALARTLGGLVPGAQVAVQGWREAMAGPLFPARAATVALGVLGLLGTMLAVTGLFGRAAYDVSRRMKELGLRVAVGARPGDVLSAAVGRPLALLAAGSAAGLLLGAAGSRWLGRIVYQADPRDPVVMGGAVLAMALLGLAASALPALRALAVDPARLLRDE